MEKAVKKQGYIIIYIARDRIDLYSSLTNNTSSFPFAQNVVNALDVINPDEFKTQIKAFIEQNQIQPADIVIIMSPGVLFEKDIVTRDMTAEQIETATKDFLSTVPFDSLHSKKFPFEGGIRITAGSKSLTDAILFPFEKAGSKVSAIVPYEDLGPQLSEISGLDNNSVAAIVKIIDSIKSKGFVEEKDEKKTSANLQNNNNNLAPLPTPSAANNQKEKPDKKRLYLMGGVFGILILVLAYLLINPPA